MNKKLLGFGLALLLANPLFSQKVAIEKAFNNQSALEDFRYLASDELMGRRLNLPITTLLQNLKKQEQK